MVVVGSAHRLGCFEDVAEAEREREVRQVVCAPPLGQHSFLIHTLAYIYIYTYIYIYIYIYI